MKTWFRWILLTLTIGGGFTGVVIIIQAMSQSENTEISSYVIYGAFLVFNIFTVVSGLLFADNPRRTIPLMVAFCLQIPRVSSPLLAYSVTCGFSVTAGLVGGRFSANYRLGSDFMFFVFRDRQWGMGINFVALLILILLVRYNRAPHTTL